MSFSKSQAPYKATIDTVKKQKFNLPLTLNWMMGRNTVRMECIYTLIRFDQVLWKYGD